MIVTIRIPIESFEKYGVDRELFLSMIGKNVKRFIPEAEVEITKGVEK